MVRTDNSATKNSELRRRNWFSDVRVLPEADVVSDLVRGCGLEVALRDPARAIRQCSADRTPAIERGEL